jgi:hypothetical protein
MADEQVHAPPADAPAATGRSQEAQAAQEAGHGYAAAAVAEHGAPAPAIAPNEHGLAHVPVVLQPPTASDEAMAVLEPPIKRWRYLLLALLVLVLLGVLVIAGPLNIHIQVAIR